MKNLIKQFEKEAPGIIASVKFPFFATEMPLGFIRLKDGRYAEVQIKVTTEIDDFQGEYDEQSQPTLHDFSK